MLLNTAPAGSSPRCAGDPVLADAMVAARTRPGGVFYGLGEVLIVVAAPSWVEVSTVSAPSSEGR
jgi:hypothetical protein